MKTALIALFALFKAPLVRMLSSLKFWTVLLGIASSQAAKHGFEVDEATYWTIVGFFGLLLGAQGLQYHGKEAAKMKQAGFTRLESMLVVVLLGAVTACGASVRARTIRTTFDATNIAADHLVSYSAEHEAAIIHDAISVLDGEANLAAFRARVDVAVKALATTYHAIAEAALLGDGGLDAMLTAAKVLATGLERLGVSL